MMISGYKGGHRLLLRAVKIAAVLFGVLFLSYFVFRNMLLHKAIERVSNKLKNRYGLILHVEESRFSGLAGIEMQGISVVPENGDTLVTVGNFETSVRLLHALIGQIRIKKVVMQDGYLQLSKRNGIKNFNTLFHPKDSLTSGQEKAKEKKARLDFAATAYKIIDGVLDRIPSQMQLRNFSLKINDEKLSADFILNECIQDHEQLNAKITTLDNKTDVQHWVIEGTADPGGKKADLHLYHEGAGKVTLPYISNKLNLVTGFDSIHIELDEVKYSSGILHIRGQSGIRNFMINHPKISKKDVIVDNASVDYHFILDEASFSLDSSTNVTFNKVAFHPFIKLETATDTIFSLSAMIPEMQAQDFITSLPEGLFTHFKGMEVSGVFDYRLDFVYNENHPQNLIFESVLHKKNLRILKYGEADLDKLNREFVYVPMERGRPMRPVFVGVANPDYTPLAQISPYLQKCVLTTEDPSFFYHRGFIDEAFRQSIIKNIRKKKFARGASTISMQLVKNVFLTREKTMSRKLEEILLVYILENNRISSKERMLEVYFNIIEWGPDVYGIGEAARFYFNKRPSQLTFKECLFLATIIPRPKGFMWRFDKEGKLKPFAEKQFGFLTRLMLMRNLLAPEDTTAAAAPVQVTGNARSFIKIAKDTAVMDSIIIDENGIIRSEDE